MSGSWGDLVTPLVRRRGALFVVLGASLSRDEAYRLNAELTHALAQSLGEPLPEHVANNSPGITTRVEGQRPPAPGEDIPTRRETPISIAALRDTDPAPPGKPSSSFRAVTEDLQRELEKVKK